MQNQADVGYAPIYVPLAVNLNICDSLCRALPNMDKARAGFGQHSSSRNGSWFIQRFKISEVRLLLIDENIDEVKEL
jgi:hypothetical protein